MGWIGVHGVNAFYPSQDYTYQIKHFFPLTVMSTGPKTPVHPITNFHPEYAANNSWKQNRRFFQKSLDVSYMSLASVTEVPAKSGANGTISYSITESFIWVSFRGL